jgi:hypothetical protein
MSQAVSGEIVLEKLLERFMRTAITQAGAQRGLLILLRGVEPQIEASRASAGAFALLSQAHTFPLPSRTNSPSSAAPCSSTTS